MTFNQVPRARPPCRRPGFLGTPPGPFFHKIHFHISLASRGAQSGAKDGPKCSKGAKQEPQSSLARAKTVTFWCQIGESGPLPKQQQGLCFHHIMKVRAPPFSLPKATPERNVHQSALFHTFVSTLGPQMFPKAPQGSPKGARGAPSLGGSKKDPPFSACAPLTGLTKVPSRDPLGDKT